MVLMPVPRVYCRLLAPRVLLQTPRVLRQVYKVLSKASRVLLQVSRVLLQVSGVSLVYYCSRVGCLLQASWVLLQLGV